MLCCGCNNDVEDNDCVQLDGEWYCNECTTVCEKCEEAVCNDDIRFVKHVAYCESCYDDEFVSCEHCNGIVNADDAVRSESNDWYCQSCYNDNFYRCDSCDCELSSDDICSSEYGDCMCQSCYDERYTRCHGCDCEVSNDDVYSYDYNVYCESCVPRDKAEWGMDYHRRSHVIDNIRSTRQFGVELETSKCPDHTELEGRTIFECKEDGSIDGMEFACKLADDNGLTVVEDFCKLANRNGFEVNSNCGYHLHLDMSSETIESMKSIAYAYHTTYEVWASFVNESRRENKYCQPNTWTLNDLASIAGIEDFRSWGYNMDRRQWFNVAAYNRHKTFEIRLHSGTVDGEKVCNWIKAHTRFADWAASKSITEIDDQINGSNQDKFDALSDIWDDAELTDYYADRARRFGTVYTDCAYA